MPSRLIIVANRLPITISETAGKLSYQPSPGGLASALSSIQEMRKALWVGCSGIGRTLSNEELAQLDLPKNLYPVNVPAETYNRYYNNVANATMWPISHGFTPLRTYTPDDWKACLTVIDDFVAILTQILKPDDVLWIHDFHLLMLPAALRRAGITNKIGFFMHVPFPVPAMFAKIPNHQEILESLLQTDLFGLQTQRDVVRMRKCIAEFASDYKTNCHVQNFPIGIDFKRYQEAISLPEAKKYLAVYRNTLHNKRLIFSVSRLDYTKGIRRQLIAVDRLFASSHEYDDVLYKVVVAPSRESVTEYSKLKEEIDELAHKIEQRWPGRLYYQYESAGIEQLSAYYAVADVMLNVPTIDGMNLIAKEYVAAKKDDPGVLVLSKEAGAAAQMKEAILVDPGDFDSITEALKQALAMPKVEQLARLEKLRKGVEKQDVFWWADKFLRALEATER